MDVPPPVKFFKCQKYGLSAVRCKSDREISVCGFPPHSPDPCPSPSKCPNCYRPLEARSRDCIEFKIEQEIQKMRTKMKDLTVRQARALVSSTL